MKITVLGCWGAYPEAGGATSGYLFETGDHRILLDCGSGVLSNLFKFVRAEDLDAVFLSHYHHDHLADLGCLMYASKFATVFKRRQEPLPIFAHKGSPRFSELSFKEYTIGKEINPGVTVDLKGLKVTFAQTVHEALNLAMRFEYHGKTLIYTGDLGPASELADFCRGADFMVCETSLFAHEGGMFSGHMTTKETAELAGRAGVKELMITHFPHSDGIMNMPDEVRRYYQGNVWMAESNKTYEF